MSSKKNDVLSKAAIAISGLALCNKTVMMENWFDVMRCDIYQFKAS